MSKVHAIIKWRNLRKEINSGESVAGIKTIPLSINTSQGQLRLAVGESNESKLLIPIHPREHIDEKLKGESLVVDALYFFVDNKKIRYLSITCLNNELEEVFSELVDDIARRIEENKTAMRAVSESLKEFRALMKPDLTKLERRKVAGLIGELIFLDKVVDENPDMWKTWQGPQGARHDFRTGNMAVEVKTSMSKINRIIEINSLYQLEIPENGSLYLVHYVIESNRSGDLDVPGLIESVQGKTGNPDELEELIKLTEYDEKDKKIWSEHKFLFRGVDYYSITEEFPSLTRVRFKSDPPTCISDVRYKLDLAGASNFIMGKNKVDSFISEFCEVL